jgi:Nuclease-related domain
MLDWLYPYVCGAGRGAQTRHNAAAKRWRRRVLRKLQIPFGAVAVLLIILEMTNRDLTSWLLGLALGAVIGLYLAFRDSLPAYIENWRTGAEGERRTAGALAPLRRHGYVLLHDLSDRPRSDRAAKGNIDHVVVGPAGVFLLDSKWLGGEASIDSDTVRVQMLDDEEESYELTRLASGMRGRAVRLQEDIARQTGVRNVQAVVVFWNRFTPGLVKQNRVVYAAGAHVTEWLRQQSPTIAAARVPFIADAIHEARAPAKRTRWERLRARRPKLEGGDGAALTT